MAAAAAPARVSAADGGPELSAREYVPSRGLQAEIKARCATAIATLHLDKEESTYGYIG
jgi:hypothetical protein